MIGDTTELGEMHMIGNHGFQSTPSDFSTNVEGFIRKRLNGRISDLRIVLQGNGVVLQGHAPTFYAKQLAQLAVMKLTDRPIVANLIEVC